MVLKFSTIFLKTKKSIEVIKENSYYAFGLKVTIHWLQTLRISTNTMGRNPGKRDV